MARYTGAVCRLCRHAGDKLMLKGDRCYTPKCAVERRGRGPGQQQSTRRRRLSDHALQLLEKQKARYSYGMLERQFKRFFDEAARLPGITGDTLLVLLEKRLDNVVYRLGFADSRSQSRQLVRHGHILLNGQKTNIPSCVVKEGDTVSWREGSTNTEYYILLTKAIAGKTVPNWLSLDQKNLVGKVVSMPAPEDVEVKFDGHTIVEFYSR